MKSVDQSTSESSRSHAWRSALQPIKVYPIMVTLWTIVSPLSAQYKVRFTVHDMALNKRDSIMISGTFNDWEEANNPKYFLYDDGPGKKSIELVLSPGHHEYKYTGGTWLSTEKGVDGKEIPNRVINLTRDTMLMDTVSDWRDMLIKNLKLRLTGAVDDTTRLSILNSIASNYAFNRDYYQLDSALYYIRLGLEAFEKVKANPDLATPKNSARQTLLLNELEIMELAKQHEVERQLFHARLQGYWMTFGIVAAIGLVLIVYLYKRR